MRYAILQAPSNLGLRPTGVEEAPTALLELGLGQRLRARHAGRVEAPSYSPVRDPLTNTLNARSIAAYAATLADRVTPILEQGELPIVLGGDCSILLGTMLSLRRRGRYGVLFLDGHVDYWTPETEPQGEAASMDLALVTGRGPSLLTDLEGRCPLVDVQRVIAFGMRDDELDPDYVTRDAGQLIPPELERITLADIRRTGFAHASAMIAQSMARRDGDGFWIHLDVDVLDDAIMPAVDYRMPQGLSWNELSACLGTALASRRAIGLEVTIYNPRLDPGLAGGRGLVDALVDGLR